MNNQQSPPHCTCQKEHLSISRKTMWATVAGVFVTALVGWLAFVKKEDTTFQQTIKQKGNGNQAGLLIIKRFGADVSQQPETSKLGKIQQAERPEFKSRAGGGPSWVF